MPVLLCLQLHVDRWLPKLCAAVVFELLGIVSLYSIFVTFWLLLFGKCFLISLQSGLLSEL